MFLGLKHWVLRGLCLFRHDPEPLFGRDADGRAVWECRRCGRPVECTRKDGTKVPYRVVGSLEE